MMLFQHGVLHKKTFHLIDTLFLIAIQFKIIGIYLNSDTALI